NTSDAAAFEELAGWYGNAAVVLETLRAATPTASEVRCWPHHFDLATLITVAPGQSVGVGMEPGDQYYAEPYFYVNMHPAPDARALPPLHGHGTWHTHEWIGAVLPASRLAASGQRSQIERFTGSAVAVGVKTG